MGFLIVVLGLLLRAPGVCVWPCQTQGLLSQENLTGKVQGFELNLTGFLGFNL